MKLRNLSSKLFLVFSLAVISYGCKKVETPKKMGDAGQTLIKLVADEDNYALIAIDLVSTSQSVNVLEIRRDVPSEGELNKTMAVVIKQDPAVLSSFNSAFGTSYVALPTANYTVDPANPRVGTDFSVTFQPGEFVKYLKITIPNSTAINLNSTYAFGFTIASVDGGGKISAAHKTAVVEIAFKNKYDGHYRVTGTMVDLTTATITGKYPFEVDLITWSANSVIMYHTGTPFTGYYHPILSGTATSAYGNYAPIFIFDAANKVIDLDNGYGQGAGSRWAKLDPSGANTFNTTNHNLTVKYFMNQPSATTTRTTFDEVFTYTGPR